MGYSDSDQVIVSRLMQRIRTGLDSRNASPLETCDYTTRKEMPVREMDLFEAERAPQWVHARGSELSRPVPLSLADPETIDDTPVFQLAADRRYVVQDLLGFNDRQFVYVAYRAIMLRLPDDGGLNTYLRLLRNGTPKEEILQILRNSPEGRTAAVTLIGLASRIFWVRVSRLPIVGKLFSIATALWNLPQSERNRCADEGRIVALVERTHEGLARSVLLVNRALRDGESSNLQLATYTASRAGHNDIENIDKEIRKIRESMADLRGRDESRANASDFVHLQQSHATLCEQFAMGCKVSHELRTSMSGLCTQIESRASAADVASLKRTHAALQAQYDTDHKVIRADLTALDQARSEYLTSLEHARFEVITTLDEARLAVHNELESLAKSKVNSSALRAASAESKAALDAAVNPIIQDLVGLSELRSLVGIREDFDNRMTLADEDRDVLRAAQIEVTKGNESALRNMTEQLAIVAQTKSDLMAVESFRVEMGASLEAIRREGQEALHRASTLIASQAHDLKVNILDQERRLALLLVEARKRLPEPLSTDQINKLTDEESHLLDAMYSSFEDRFRGTRADIKQYQTSYLPYIREAKAGSQERPILDLGCGRGEWLEVLSDEGLAAQGTEVNRVFLGCCRELDLNVIERDALELLQSMKAHSVGAITSFHLIEHLEFKRFIALLDESLRVLKPGGILILETPNPENILVGACNFYYDPTHIRPLPPQSTRFLVEARGFVNVVVKDLHPNANFEVLIEESPKLAQLFSNGQDYALIGWKV